MWLVMKSYHLGAFLQFFFFPENVIMTRLEFLKLVLHCIEELTEQQTPFFFFTQGLVGFSVHLSDNVNSVLINQTLVKSQGSFLGHKESIDLCTLLIKTCHCLVLWVQFPFTVLLMVYSIFQVGNKCLLPSCCTKKA